MSLRLIFLPPAKYLSGKVALVTGGGAGIGRTMAEAMAKAGASVVISSRRTELLAKTVGQILKFGGKSNFVPFDLTEVKRIKEFVKNVSTFYGPPDILVNAAGINLREPSENITHESWEKTLGINWTLTHRNRTHRRLHDGSRSFSKCYCVSSPRCQVFFCVDI